MTQPNTTLQQKLDRLNQIKDIVSGGRFALDEIESLYEEANKIHSELTKSIGGIVAAIQEKNGSKEE